MHIAHQWFFFTIFISLTSVGLGLFLIFGEVFLLEPILGWGMTFTDHCLRWGIRKYGRMKKASNALACSMGLNGVRTVVFFLAIIFVVVSGKVTTAPFVFSVFTAYFIFLIYSIMRMHIASIDSVDT